MSYRNFREWLVQEQKKDIFGFEKHRAQPTPPQDTNPVQPLDCESIVKELMRHPIGLKQPTWDFFDQITWGDKKLGEALRLDITPLGSLKVISRRFTKDLEGNDVWICKDIRPLPDYKYKNKEASLAEALFEKIAEIDKSQSDSAGRDYNLENLAIRLGGEIKMRRPCKYMVFDRIKRLTENHYILALNMVGNGCDVLRHSGEMSRVEQFHINLFWDKNRGLIRCFGNDIESPKRFSKWEAATSDWDEHFAPTQPKEEIITAIVNALSTY